MKTLSEICQTILIRNVASIDSLGDAPFKVVRSLLHAVPKASQLHLIEYNSPHLHPDSEEVWEQRCSTDFVRIRIQVEDRTMLKPESWRALYIQNELATAAKLESLRNKLRTTANDAESAKRSIGTIDGMAMSKKTKKPRLTPASRPKSLMEIARSNAAKTSAKFSQRHSSNPSSFDRRPIPTYWASVNFPSSKTVVPSSSTASSTSIATGKVKVKVEEGTVSTTQNNRVKIRTYRIPIKKEEEVPVLLLSPVPVVAIVSPPITRPISKPISTSGGPKKSSLFLPKKGKSNLVQLAKKEET